MNNKTSKRGFLIPLLALLLLLNSCDLSKNETSVELSTLGTWTDAYGGKIEITVDQYTSYWSNNGVETLSHTAEITSFKNNELNADEAETSVGDYGYFVVKYDLTNGGAGAGKYGIVRWKSLTALVDVTTMSYSEGYNTTGYFDTEDEAIAGMTAEANYFGWYSTMTKE